MRLFPRLLRSDASELSKELASMTVAEARGRAASSVSGGLFPPSGGAPLTSSELSELADHIRSVAGEFGYPERPDRGAARGFDVRAAIELHRTLRGLKDALVRL